MKVPRCAFLCFLFSASPLGLIDAMQPDFEPNVTVFDPNMPLVRSHSLITKVRDEPC
jgi:hypothetical protein